MLKDPSERATGSECNECANETSGLVQGGVRIVMIMAILQERQGSVLTNQCLGKETNAERGAKESFLTDSGSDKFIVVETTLPGHPGFRKRLGCLLALIKRLLLKTRRRQGR